MKDYSSPNRAVAMPEPIDPKDIIRKMKMEYNNPAAGKTSEILDQIGGLLDHLHKPRMELQEFLTDAANLMLKEFWLKTVSIGLRESDGIYRYKALAGFRHEPEIATKELEYTYEQFTDSTVYKGYMISKHTKVFLAEDNPWRDSEKESYDMPSQLGMTRKSIDDYVEGDYTDIHILNKYGEILGWIEFTSTASLKRVDMPSIRWIEFIGRVIAAEVSTSPLLP